MIRCLILGHDWFDVGPVAIDDNPFGNIRLWECLRCGNKTEDLIEPPRWTWATGYPMGDGEEARPAATGEMCEKCGDETTTEGCLQATPLGAEYYCDGCCPWCDEQQGQNTDHSEVPTMANDEVELTLSFDDLPVSNLDFRKKMLDRLPTDDVEEGCIRWIPAGGEPHRYRFVETDDETVRVHEEWTGQEWREVGREQVTSLKMMLDGKEVFAGP